MMGDKCSLCGYDKARTALELHHLNSDEKEFTVGQCLNRAWDTLHEEIKKCVLVCANCHREIHEGIITEELKSSYIPERGTEIDKKIYDLKHHKIHYCPCCGKEITATASYCKDCSNIARQKVERPSREELKELIRNLPFVEIGRRYGVSDNAIRHWCKKYDLPSKKTVINNYTDEEWLKI